MRVQDYDLVAGMIALIPVVVATAIVIPKALFIIGAAVAFAAWVNACFYIVRKLAKRRESGLRN